MTTPPAKYSGFSKLPDIPYYKEVMLTKIGRVRNCNEHPDPKIKQFRKQKQFGDLSKVTEETLLEVIEYLTIYLDNSEFISQFFPGVAIPDDMCALMDYAERLVDQMRTESNASEFPIPDEVVAEEVEK